MAIDALSQYKGIELPARIQSFLSIISKHSCRLVVTGASKKTIRIFNGDRNLGYINSTVIRRQAIVGYHFLEDGNGTDACAKGNEGSLIQDFCNKYECEPDDIDIHSGVGANSGRTFLLIRDPRLALEILCQASNGLIEENIVLLEIERRFVEGRVSDVVMKRRERDPKARSACLAAYGFNCYACGINLKSKYCGLDVEVIHVHHEEPLSQSEGAREIYPIATMKPLCPNCHAVIHSRTPPYSITEIRGMLDNEI